MACQPTEELPLFVRRTYTRVTARAPAKVNLVLAVGARRRDGYHTLATVFQAVDLYDELELTRADRLSVEVTGEGAGDVPTDDSNLAARAVLLLAEHTGCSPAVTIRLRKDIPVAGGCAGGSADAAAALVAGDALWGAGLGRDELETLAASLGSDVPFSLRGGTALGTGRGEQLTPVLSRGACAWVLAFGDQGLSTPAVYAELDRQRDEGPVGVMSDTTDVLSALSGGDPVALGRRLCNDLAPAAIALRPSLQGLIDTGLALGALGAMVSGSGPTLAFLARDREHGAALQSALAAAPGCRAARQAEGPVTGARVVTAS